MVKKYSVKLDDKIYEVEIQDLQSRPVVAVVDGVTFEVWPENGQAQPATHPASVASSHTPLATAQKPHAAAHAPTSALTSNCMRAPIPGVVIAVKVSAGDMVEIGQELVVLEAMKMRNAIRSGRSGIISAVCVAVGQSVPHNEVLVEFQE